MKTTREPSRALAVFFLFCILGLAYSWPLPLHFTEGVPYSYNPDPALKTARMIQGDHLQAYYHIGLMKPAATGEISWFSNPYEFATEHQKIRTSDYFLPVSIIFLPFSFISGPMAYNILVITALGLGGLAMYLWAWRLTGSRMAGLAAGLVFNFAPVRLVELYGGHPAGLAIFLFPLTLYYFDRAVEERSAAAGALGGLAAFILSIQYNFFSYYLLMLFIIYIPWRIVPLSLNALPASADDRGGILPLIKAGVPFALGLLATIGYMLHFKKSAVGASAVSGGRSLNEVALFSPPLSGLWDVQAGWNVYLGFALTAVIVGLAFGLFSAFPKKMKRDALFFTFVFAGTYVLAFGVSLIEIFPLYKLFYNYFPYFNFSRTPAKIMVITGSAISILAAYSVLWAMKSRIAAVLATIIVIATALDYHPRNGVGVSLMDEGNKVYAKLAEVAGEEYVVNIPIWPGESSWSSLYEYYALQSAVPTINGYNPLVSKEYIDNVFWPLFTVNAGDLTAEQVALLKKLNVGYLIFHEETYPPKVSAFPPSFALERLKNSPHLKLIARGEPLWLFKILDFPQMASGAIAASPVAGFFQAEALNRIHGKPVNDPDALNGLTLEGKPVQPAKERILNAGPYRTFPSGDYKTAFRIKIGDNSKAAPAVKIDVAGDEGRIVLAQRIINASEFAGAGKYQDFWLKFSAPPGRPWQFEFRTYILGDTPVYVDSFYTLQQGVTDPALELETEKFFYTGKIVDDPEASGGKAVLSDPANDPATVMAYGPYRIYEAGKYTARLRAKYENGDGGGPLGFMKVNSANSGDTLAQTAITAKELPGPGKYGEITLDFTLGKTDVLEFRVSSGGVSKLYADKIELVPAGSSR